MRPADPADKLFCIEAYERDQLSGFTPLALMPISCETAEHRMCEVVGLEGSREGIYTLNLLARSLIA